MSLYVRVNCNFYSHRKRAKLGAQIGNETSLWLPPRLWAYAAENQPDGDFSNYSATEIAHLLGYNGDPDKMLQALLQAGFMDDDPLRIHDWHEFNGYHVVYADRAKKAANARWQKQKESSKEKVPETDTEKERRGEEKSQALLQASAGERGAQPPPSSTKQKPREVWQLLADLERVRKSIGVELNRQKPDEGVLKVLRKELKTTKDDIKANGHSTDAIEDDEKPKSTNRNAGSYNEGIEQSYEKHVRRG